MKTLVASHNPDLARDFDRELLRRHDLRLVTARTTTELIHCLAQGGDLCFLDRVLPDGDGETALAAIRADRRLHHIPVVMVSGAGAPASDRARARELGFADVVELPAPPGSLSLLVARLLGVPLRGDDRFAVRSHVFQSDAGPPSLAHEKDAEAYLGTSIDLSEAGMLLKARREVAVGATVGLRFTLPGRSEELHLPGRVVRVDIEGFTPAFGLALAFDSLSNQQRSELHDYLRVLVGGRPFSWQISHEGGRQVVALSGVLQADSDLTGVEKLSGEVTFRMREFRRISSDSVQRWIEVVRSLGAVTQIRLIECPISFIHQANLITNLLERQEVESFYAPYVCDRCGLDEEKLIDVEQHLEGGKRRLPPLFFCSSCRGPLQFDDLVDHFFAFLERK